MYKDRLLASLQAGEITDLQQKALRQEFIDAVGKEGFMLCQCSRQGLLCRHKDDNGIYLSLMTNQDARGETETPNPRSWGQWCLCDAAGQPVSLGGSQPAGGNSEPSERSCTGFWLEGIENIRSFTKAYQRHHG